MSVPRPGPSSISRTRGDLPIIIHCDTSQTPTNYGMVLGRGKYGITANQWRFIANSVC